MNDDVRIFNTKSPPQHADAHLIDANETYLFGSRGSLKTWLAGSLYLLRRIFEMPRSTGVIVGISFEHMMDNTLPPLRSFFASRGIIEGEHYVLMKPPPEHWPKPYSGVLDPSYKHAWTWYNGTTIQMVSLRRVASANGVSAQWGYFDEVKFMDQSKLEDIILPIIRPIEISDPIFKDCSGYLSKFFSTDKMADPVKIEWLLKKRELVNWPVIEQVRNLQLYLLDKKNELQDLPEYKRGKLLTEIKHDEDRLRRLRSNLVYVSEVNADDVRPILGERWYKDKQKNSKKRDWDIIYLNKDPDRPGELFYPGWNSSIHVYHQGDDILKDEPVIIAADYQHTISPISVAQIGTLPWANKLSLNIIEQAYTLHPEGLRAAVKLFCGNFEKHTCKQVYYVYDHTAVAERNDAEKFTEIVIDELEKQGWIVWEVNTGQAPGHYDKYVDTNDWMVNETGEYLDIRVSARCNKIIKSIEKAGAYTVGKETKKDKRPELLPELDQSETTHFSDTVDMILDAVFKKKLINYRRDRIPFGFASRG